MTSIPPPHHMYADSAIRFRDPFFSKDRQPEPARAGWAYLPHLDFSRALTPPPDMNGGPHSAKPLYPPRQEHEHHYGDHISDRHAYRAPVTTYLPQESSASTLGQNGVVVQPGNRALSPAVLSRATASEDAPAQSQSRRGSQANNTIAPSFQIPRAVNDSGGSLSELAAEITCLFWFESADVLQSVEDSPISALPIRQLMPDAKPSTGFLKWVTTILSTTLVAQNVVLLALLFIYRLKKINPNVRGKPGSEYRLLTVALMLGNKFLDDNTYTNKTWAEVSGINVGEVHIMEVEFLSNMKYCLFTSVEDWAKWQSLLGRFATFVERAQRPAHPAPASILPPASSLHLPMALPSPPASNHASPPFVIDVAHAAGSTGAAHHGPTPAPSPLAALPDPQTNPQVSRKRSRDEYSMEPAPKRMAGGLPTYQSPHHHGSNPVPTVPAPSVPRLPLPSLAIPTGPAASGSYALPASQGQQLPPLTVPARAMAMVYPNAGGSSQASHLPAVAAALSQPASQVHSQYQSRQHSPFPGSATGSPTSAPPPTSSTSLHPPAQVSPSYFLQQRNSPYRPVHHVSTLLYPPPSGALQQRVPSVEHEQMHYQPLGKPIQQQKPGRLPYVAQNIWPSDTHPQSMTPVHQWPLFHLTRQQQRMLSQQ